MVREVSIEAFSAAHKDGAIVIDVRDRHEYESGHVPGARNIPLSLLPWRTHELPKDREIHVICAGGGRSQSAVQYLAGSGFKAVSVSGGTQAWIKAGKPIVNGSRENVA
jgi:rhodanese-related sulfurtransferase